MPSPPTTTAPRNVNDSSSVNDSGATKPCPYANSAPPTPAYAPATANSSALVRLTCTPLVRAARSPSRIATSARPRLPRVRLAASSSISAVTTRLSR